MEACLINTISIQDIIALLTNNMGFYWDSRTVIGRTRHVTSPIWSRIDWLTGPKIRIVGLVLLSSNWIKQFIQNSIYRLGGANINCNRIFQFYNS